MKRLTPLHGPLRHGRARMGTFVNRVPRFFRAAGGGECGIGFRGPVRRSISWAARDVGERGLVKVEAAGGGGRRPAFTRPRSPTTIAWRDRGAESMPGENLVVGMRQLFMRVDLDGSRSGPGTHALDRHGGGVRRLGPSGRAEDRASGAFSFGRGLNFPPILIDPRRPFMRLRPKACILVSGGVLGTHNHHADLRSATARDRGGGTQS